ncbi:MAG: histidine--tRNA ligase [Clostridia bacterium]|nr:histidine--tRNA ligase [Clostridia bacterium]
MEIRAPKGTKDITPLDSYRWQYVEGVIRSLCAKYCFSEVRTPVFEHTELFSRGVGDTTDIVQKEMYTFLDKGERSITLKPEGTASVVRMYIENRLYNEAQPTKMYYLSTPVFRYERPQAGRLREHHQFGVEIFGAKRASADAECIMLALELLNTIGIRGLSVRINSIGCPKCRADYNAKLQRYLHDHVDALCATCRDRLGRNPLRVLDCKEEACKRICADAPVCLDSLCDECRAHHEELCGCLDAARVDYVVDPYIVRGLDYYTKTVFEIVSNDIGAQGTVCGGGRYDLLIEELGGPSTPAVGFGLGMERLLLVAQNTGVEFPAPEPPDVYVAPVSDEQRQIAFALAFSLRKAGVKAECEHSGRSLKAQLKFAAKIGARFVAVIGEDEAAAQCVQLKNMGDGASERVPLCDIAERIR